MPQALDESEIGQPEGPLDICAYRVTSAGTAHIMAPKLLVFGGTGLVGSRICRAAKLSGWNVTSVSRGSNSGRADLMADVFQPSQYAQELANADAVVHSIGSIMDNPQYKRIVNEPLSAFSLLELGRLRLRGRNPLATDVFSHLNTDSARIVAETIQPRPGKRIPFVYISAEDWMPLADPAYIRSKRRAEQILSGFAHLRPVYLRPGFIVDSSGDQECWPTTRGALGRLLNIVGSPHEVSVDTVASAAVQALEDPDIEGIVPCEALKELETAY